MKWNWSRELVSSVGIVHFSRLNVFSTSTVGPVQFDMQNVLFWFVENRMLLPKQCSYYWYFKDDSIKTLPCWSVPAASCSPHCILTNTEAKVGRKSRLIPDFVKYIHLALAVVSPDLEWTFSSPRKSILSSIIDIGYASCTLIMSNLR